MTSGLAPETTRSWIAMGATRVTVGDADDAIVLSVDGPLDADGGRLVREVTEAAILSRSDERPIEVDLRGVARLTVDGLRAIAECAALGPGVRFRMGRVESIPVDD
ncbi:MAG TPA: hypothetical protein VFZ83_02165 [Acidimicrobiia bacterium]|nr:hypothetical protein [Acidimicrobiia bacterium]